MVCFWDWGGDFWGGEGLVDGCVGGDVIDWGVELFLVLGVWDCLGGGF